MAYPKTRSMNSDLFEGMTDGRYKKMAMNQGGVINPILAESREDFCDIWYGFHEVKEKMLGDGREKATPCYQPNALAKACEEGI